MNECGKAELRYPALTLHILFGMPCCEFSFLSPIKYTIISLSLSQFHSSPYFFILLLVSVLQEKVKSYESFRGGSAGIGVDFLAFHSRSVLDILTLGFSMDLLSLHIL